MKLADMTWDEVRRYLKKKDSLIIPVGTCEQHGYHLPIYECLVKQNNYKLHNRMKEFVDISSEN